jgi:acyl-CoA thioesterase-1
VVQDAYGTRRQRPARAGRYGLSAFLLILASALPAFAGPKPVAPMVEARCRAGAAQNPFKPILPVSARTLTETNRLAIVAIGSSTTAGTGAGEANRGYPAMLEEELRRRLPTREIKVTNLGVGGQSAYEMYAAAWRADDDRGEPGDLVIWQTVGERRHPRHRRGEAGEDPAQGHRQGCREAGIDLVLMDHALAAARGALSEVRRLPHGAGEGGSARGGVAVFPRYVDDEGLVGLDALQRGARSSAWTGMQVVEAGYRCLAIRLADGIAAELGGGR